MLSLTSASSRYVEFRSRNPRAPLKSAAGGRAPGDAGARPLPLGHSNAAQPLPLAEASFGPDDSALSGRTGSTVWRCVPGASYPGPPPPGPGNRRRCCHRDTPRCLRTATTRCPLVRAPSSGRIEPCDDFIAERMDHHEVQVGHRGPDHRVPSVALAKILDQFVHQVRNVDRVGAGVHDVAGRFISYVNSTGSPSAGTLVEGVAHHHVVETADEAFVVNEVGIVRELKDIRHRVAVADHGHPCLVLGIQRFFAATAATASSRLTL